MDPNSPLFHAKHVLRVGFLFVLGVIGLIVLRSWLAPPTWGQYGPYRGASPEEHRQLPVSHGGPESCAECHESEFEEHQAGVHAPVGCELCHAPVSTHAVDGEWIAAMHLPESSDWCLTCHTRLSARPRTFPQVDPRAHLEEMGGEPGPKACFECHEPHSPF